MSGPWVWVLRADDVRVWSGASRPSAWEVSAVALALERRGWNGTELDLYRVGPGESLGRWVEATSVNFDDAGRGEL